MNDDIKALPRTGLCAMPRGIWAFGLVSIFMDISSEMIHGPVPVFLVSVRVASPDNS